jgi:hypothetical protein
MTPRTGASLTDAVVNTVAPVQPLDKSCLLTAVYDPNPEAVRAALRRLLDLPGPTTPRRERVG